MKKILLLLVTFLLSNSFVFADALTIYCEILKSDTAVSIQSHLFWNVDENINVPKSFISGRDKTFTKKIKLGKNRLKVKLFFPKQENGRKLNATTTVFVTIYLNGKKIIYTEHFGQHSEDFVDYETDILCRPSIITIFLDNDKVQTNVQGVYTPKNTLYPAYSLEDEMFALNYSLSSIYVDDTKICKDVFQYGPEPKPLNHVEESLNIGALNKTAIYSFTAEIGEYSDDDTYEWGLSSFLFCTEKATETKLTDLFSAFMPEYSLFTNQSTLRAFDPKVTYYSSDIRFNPDNITQTGKDTYMLKNLTNDYILVNGVKILNHINQKVIKISFLSNLTVESVEVGENITYKLDKNVLYLYGDGNTRLNYKIYVRKKDL